MVLDAQPQKGYGGVIHGWVCGSTIKRCRWVLYEPDGAEQEEQGTRVRMNADQTEEPHERASKQAASMEAHACRHLQTLADT